MLQRMRPYIFSFRIGGVVVRAEPSWLFLALLVGWSLASGFFPGLRDDFSLPAYIAMAVAGVAGLTFSIIAHELSHTFVGRAFGLPINHVTLFLFGGAAELESEPETPMSELVMALAGPLMSLVLAGVFALAGGALVPQAAGDPVGAVALVLGYLSLINLLLAMFNMIPAFPLDGGRVLRAILWLFTGDRRRATGWASGAGEFFAYVFIASGAGLALFAGQMGGIWWVLIGLFLRTAAVSARNEQDMKHALAGVAVGELAGPFETAQADMSVADFIEEVLVRHHRAWVPVVEADGQLVGGAGVEEARAVPAAERASTPVRRIALPVRESERIDAPLRASGAFARMQHDHLARLYVVKDGQLAGVVSLSDLMEYARMRRLFDGDAAG